MQRLSETQKGKTSRQNGKQAQGPVRNDGVSPKKKGMRILPILLILMGCGVFMFAAWSAINSPAFASILNGSAPAPVAEQAAPRLSFAQAYIAKPAAAPLAVEPVAQVVPTPTFTALPVVQEESLPEAVIVPPTEQPTLEVAVLPEVVEPQATAQPEATSEPGAISAEILADTPTPEYVQPTAVVNVPAQVVSNGGEHWIDVNLSEQRVYAYEGDTVVNSFIVSTGTWQTPTVTGNFKIWIKVRSQAMTGPGYYLPDVPYVMYFYQDYGLHGTYWHNNFGTPMSHGCVNLRTEDAAWLYNFASVGTVVNVHY